MKKRLLIHAPNLTTPGGKQTYYAAVNEYFSDEISFFFYGAQGRKESRGAFLKRLIRDYYRFWRQLKGGHFDLALLNPSLNMKSFFRDSFFALICFLMGVKFVVFWHGWQWEFEKKVAGRLRHLFLLTYGRAAGMIVLAREFQERIRAYGYRKPIFLETTVVDDFIFNYENYEPSAPPASDGETVILYLARVEKVKGIYETIDSFHALQSRRPGLKLNIAGAGGELERARAYVEQKGIRNIYFLGWITGPQKARALYEADIFVLPSYHGEGMPCSLLEAMACGLSVVTTDAGGIKDFFQPWKMGLFVRPADTAHLERQLEVLLSNPELLESTKAFNAGYARTHFTPALVAGRLEHIFESVTSEKEVRRPLPVIGMLTGFFSGFLSWPPQRKQILTAMAIALLAIVLAGRGVLEIHEPEKAGEGVVEEAVEEVIEEVVEELVEFVDHLDGQPEEMKLIRGDQGGAGMDQLYEMRT